MAETLDEEIKRKAKNAVSKEEFEDFSKRVFKLSKEDIDTLFHLCGWKEDGCEKDGNKALPQERLEYMKKKIANTKEWIDNLLFDTPYEADILSVKKALEGNLRKIEKEKHQ